MKRTDPKGVAVACYMGSEVAAAPLLMAAPQPMYVLYEKHFMKAPWSEIAF